MPGKTAGKILPGGEAGAACACVRGFLRVAILLPGSLIGQGCFRRYGACSQGGTAAPVPGVATTPFPTPYAHVRIQLLPKWNVLRRCRTRGQARPGGPGLSSPHAAAALLAAPGRPLHGADLVRRVEGDRARRARGGEHESAGRQFGGKCLRGAPQGLGGGLPARCSQGLSVVDFLAAHAAAHPPASCRAHACAGPVRTQCWMRSELVTS